MEQHLSRRNRHKKKAGDNRRQASGKRRLNKKTKSSIILIAILLFGMVGTIFYRIGFVNPVDTQATELIGGFKFEHQETIRDIADQLEAKGLINSSLAFQIKARLRGINYVGKAGNYAFTKAMSPDEILTMLATGQTAYDFQIPIGDGSNIDKLLFDFSGGDAAEINRLDQLINDVAYIEELRGRYAFLPEELLGDHFRHRLEGFLAPGMYYLRDEDNIKVLIEQALNNFNDNYIRHHWRDKLIRVDKSLFEVMTMASVVRAEVTPGDTENQKKVAGVFYNRLEDGMPLGSDPTVGYAINAPDINYTQAELAYDSPYNTYMYAGLPRGPINNPGPSVVDAIIDYTKSDYYFFIADICDDGIGVMGEVYYGRTEDEHEAYIKKYLGCYRDV
jgi:UPF0755 protein